MPNACIGVDVIVGHPGETPADFLETYQFLNDLDISYLHVFTYSERPNTKALEIKPVVPKSVRAERSEMLHILSDKKRRYFYESQVGKQGKVLFEEDIKDGKMYGFSDNYIKIEAQYDPLLINEVVDVNYTQLNDSGYMEVEQVDTLWLQHH